MTESSNPVPAVASSWNATQGNEKAAKAAQQAAKAAEKTSLTQMIKEQFEESSEPVVAIFIPPVKFGGPMSLTLDFVLLKVEQDYYILSRNYMMATIGVLQMDLDKCLEYVADVTNPISYRQKGQAAQKLYRPLFTCPPCLANPRLKENGWNKVPVCGACLAAANPIKQVQLSVRRPETDTQCLKTPFEGLCDNCSGGHKMTFDVDFTTNIIKVNGEDLKI